MDNKRTKATRSKFWGRPILARIMILVYCCEAVEDVDDPSNCFEFMRITKTAQHSRESLSRDAYATRQTRPLNPLILTLSPSSGARWKSRTGNLTHESPIINVAPWSTCFVCGMILHDGCKRQQQPAATTFFLRSMVLVVPVYFGCHILVSCCNHRGGDFQAITIASPEWETM